MELEKTVKYKKEEVIEAGKNCIKKNFMIVQLTELYSVHEMKANKMGR